MKDNEDEKYSLRRNGGVIFVQTHFRTRVYWKNSRNELYDWCPCTPAYVLTDRHPC